MRCPYFKIVLPAIALAMLLLVPGKCWALASNNVSLDSPIYAHLEKLAGFGLVSSDFKGIRPYSKAEAARLVLEAESNLSRLEGNSHAFAKELIARVKELLPREVLLRADPSQAKYVELNPIASARYRYVHVNGRPRSYERPVHDPAGDGVFGIGHGLRPDNAYPSLAQQHGTEGTPLVENNEGIVYRPGSNHELRFSSEAFLQDHVSALAEPVVLYSSTGDQSLLIVNKAYVKFGGEGLELEVGRDQNWLGLGYKNAITLTNNARNFDQIKLSSPEPLRSYIGPLKYAIIFSQFDKIVVNNQEYQPYFLGMKVSLKPIENLEFGVNYAKQFGGPGVSNKLRAYVNGTFGGTNNDNTNNLAGLELRLRFPFLRNAEFYGEFSGEDSATFWPIVESYVAGLYVPRLSADGKDDFRVEYFLGNNILYTSTTFPGGYLYRGMPIGAWQGGASEEVFARYSRWFSVRNNLALEYFHLERGNTGRVTIDSSGAFDANGAPQAKERTDGGRVIWTVPVHGNIDLRLQYGASWVRNLNLMSRVNQTNHVGLLDVSYKY